MFWGSTKLVLAKLECQSMYGHYLNSVVVIVHSVVIISLVSNSPLHHFDLLNLTVNAYKDLSFYVQWYSDNMWIVASKWGLIDKMLDSCACAMMMWSIY